MRQPKATHLTSYQSIQKLYNVSLPYFQLSPLVMTAYTLMNALGPYEHMEVLKMNNKLTFWFFRIYAFKNQPSYIFSILLKNSFHFCTYCFYDSRIKLLTS